jgi:hypothetical protein
VIINQVNKSWDRNKENMDAYCLEVRKLENKFYGLEFHHVVRDNNVAEDVLSKLGSPRAQVPAGVFVHELHAADLRTREGPRATSETPWPTTVSLETAVVHSGRRATRQMDVKSAKFPNRRTFFKMIFKKYKKKFPDSSMPYHVSAG